MQAIKKEKVSGEKELKEKLKKCNQELKSLKKKVQIFLCFLLFFDEFVPNFCHVFYND